MRYGGIVLVALSLLASAAHCAESAYPSRPVRYIVTGSAGSGTDTLGRLIADGLGQVFGRQVIVENRPGGGSNMGAEMAAKSPPDGYVLFQNTITHAVNVTLYKKLTYDLLRDFAPVTQIATGPAILVVHPLLPARSVRELISLAKAKPGAINYGSGGTGTYTFLAVELFKGKAGIDLVHVPYKGGGPALTAVASGEVQVYFSPVSVALPYISEKRLRPLAVSTAKRVSLVPDLPTIAEAGLPGYESGNWYGLQVPAKTPKSIVMAIHSAMLTALNNPTVKRRLNDLGFVPIGNQPEEFAAYIKREIERLGRIVRKFKLTAED